MNKQIEEMAKITCQMYCRDKEKKCAGVQECDMRCLHYQRCEALYNAGYRKQSEGEWVKVAAYNDGVLNTVKCSVCRTYQPIGDWDYTPYCPFCGAKMKGGE